MSPNCSVQDLPTSSIEIAASLTIKATPSKVFTALTRDVRHWWGAPFLCTKAPIDLVMEPKLGGRFMEVTGEDQGYLWGTVTGFEPGKHLEIRGPIGMGKAVTGVVCLELDEKGDLTELKLFHYVFGQISEETRKSYSWGWTELLDRRLRALVERGERLGLKRQ